MVGLASVRAAALACAFAAVTASCGGSNSAGTPTAPTPSPAPAVSAAQAASAAEQVGSVTLTALRNGAAAAGIQRLGAGGFIRPTAAAGQTYGTASCAGSGRLDLVYTRDYTVTNGELDLSALKSVYSGCATGSGASALQLTGELAMTGRYYGTTRDPQITVSGTLTTPAGSCPVNAAVSGTGVFSGTACGSTVTTPPSPSPTPAVNMAGTWSGSIINDDDPSDFPHPASWVATQSGSTVTGPVAVTLERNRGTLNATLTGQISGPQITFTWTVSSIPNGPPGCSQTGTGSTTASGTSFTVQLAMQWTSACAGAVDRLSERDSLTLTRQ